MIKIIKINKQRLIGLSHKKEYEPSLINKALLKFFSSIAPRIKPRIKGGIG